MYDIAPAKRFLFIILTAHRAMWDHNPGFAHFSLVSLLTDCGFDADDWGNIPELDCIYQFWYDQRLLSQGATPDEANAAANLIAASRVGTLLSQVLKKDFGGKYTVEPNKEPGRFGGRNQYSWC